MSYLDIFDRALVQALAGQAAPRPPEPPGAPLTLERRDGAQPAEAADPSDGLPVRTLPGVMAYRHPWPASLPGLGDHRVVAFELCRARPGCSTWTWACYGATPACYRCARALAAAPHGQPG